MRHSLAPASTALLYRAKSRHNRANQVAQFAQLQGVGVKSINNKGALCEAVAAFTPGARVDAIAARLPGIPRRTLQRLLAELVNSGQLTRSGKGPATLYTAVGQPQLATEASEDYTSFINLSDTSRSLLAQLRRPLAARIPVAYQREWLAAYQPNGTFYLDEHTRGHLRRVGDTGLTSSPVGTYGRDVLDRLLIDLSWASSRLEGNTYTRLDTERLIRYGEEAAGKDALETQMILNHKRAIEVLVESVAEVGFNRYTFLNLHGLLSENLMPDPTSSGRLRLREVDISGTVYKPSAIPQLVADCFHEILLKVDSIRDPFEQAFFLLVHLPYLQLKLPKLHTMPVQRMTQVFKCCLPSKTDPLRGDISIEN
jgi:hypothetical protein